jgi:molybdenum cofactor guanylyltransferase
VRIGGIVLAGGQSRRMGVDKLRLPRHPDATTTVLQHVVQVVSAVVDDVYVVTAPGTFPEGLFPCAHILHDPHAHRGPLFALAHAWSQVDWTVRDACLVCAGDLPGLQRQVLDELKAALEQDAIAADGVVVRRDGRLQPLLAAYRSAVGQAWRSAVQHGETRLMRVVADLTCAVVDADEAQWPAWWTRPIHTPEDYEAWLSDGRSGV